MKYVVLCIALLFSVPSVAQLTSHSVSQAGFDDLTEAQKAAVIKQVSENAEMNKTVVVKSNTVETLNAFAELGKNIGAGLVAAAKELGIAANEFATTPVGKITIALIVWNYAGEFIIHTAAGILVLVTGLYICRRLFPRVYAIEYDPERRWFGFQIKKKIHYTTRSGEETWGMAIAYFGVLIVTTLILITA